MIDPDRCYRRPPGVLNAEVEGEEVLLNPETGMYHLVNRTGRALIIGMETGATLEQAVDRLAAETGTDRPRVEADALAFVEAMTRRGLLVAAPA
jgi:hypothetical protein